MTPLTRFLAFHAVIGFGIAMLFVAFTLGFDIAGLRTLIAQSQIDWIAAGALIFLLCLIVTSIQISIATNKLHKNNLFARGYRVRFEQKSPLQGSLILQPVRIKSRRIY